MTKLIDIIAGARPNFMKIAPIIAAIENGLSAEISYRLIHTGQHYDRNMSGAFFNSSVFQNQRLILILEADLRPSKRQVSLWHTNNS